MSIRSLTIAAWSSVLLTVLLWGGFAFLVFQLSAERTRYASLTADVSYQEGREKTSAQLRALIRDSKTEREMLEQLSHTDVLASASTIEAAGQAAGADVVIESAVSTPLSGKQTADLQEVIVVARAEGTFPSLMQAASLFESLPFPSEVESYELRAMRRASGARTSLWSMTTRIRIITPANTGV